MKINDDCGQLAEGSLKLQMPQIEDKPGWSGTPTPSISLAVWAGLSILLKTAKAKAVATLELMMGRYLSHRLAAPPSGSLLAR